MHNKCQILSGDLLKVLKNLDATTQQKVAGLGDKASDFLADVKRNSAIGGLLDAWSSFKKASLNDLARNTDDLEIVSDYMKRSGKSADDVASEIPSNVGDAKKWLGDRKIEPFLDAKPKVKELVGNPPKGYAIAEQANDGTIYIRRLDKTNPYTPQLTVQDGVVVKCNGPTRVSIPGRLNKNLEVRYGRSMPGGHQGHHLLPNNVFKNSPLHKYA